MEVRQKELSLRFCLSRALFLPSLRINYIDLRASLAPPKCFTSRFHFARVVLTEFIKHCNLALTGKATFFFPLMKQLPTFSLHFLSTPPTLENKYFKHCSQASEIIYFKGLLHGNGYKWRQWLCFCFSVVLRTCSTFNLFLCKVEHLSSDFFFLYQQFSSSPKFFYWYLYPPSYARESSTFVSCFFFLTSKAE